MEKDREIKAPKPVPVKPRLVSLLNDLRKQERKIDGLNRKIEALGPQEYLRPSLFKRLKSLISQISSLKRKEQDVLSEIIDMEKKHARLRKNRKLKLAIPMPEGSDYAEHERKRMRRSRDLWLQAALAFLVLRMFRKKNEIK